MVVYVVFFKNARDLRLSRIFSNRKSAEEWAHRHISKYEHLYHITEWTVED